MLVGAKCSSPGFDRALERRPFVVQPLAVEIASMACVKRTVELDDSVTWNG
jgi:hypothetical protein